MTDLAQVGKAARVVATIPAGGGEGEVIVDLPVGGSQAYPARAFDPLEEHPAGSQVWVEEQNGRTLYVVSR